MRVSSRQTQRAVTTGNKALPLDSSFELETSAAINELRRQLDRVISLLPTKVSRASELQHALGTDKALAWRVFNAVECSDAFAAARYLPRSAGIRSFLLAARKSGVETKALEGGQHRHGGAG